MQKRNRTFLILASLVLLASSPAAAQVGIGSLEGGQPDHAAFKPFAEQLAKLTGKMERIVPVESDEQLRKMLHEGTICVAIMTPLHYVLAARDHQLRLLATLERNDAQHYGSLLFAKSSAPVDSKTLSRLTLYYFGNDSASGYLYPLFLLKDHSVDIKDVKSRAKKVDGGDLDVIRAAINSDEAMFGISPVGLSAAKNAGINLGEVQKIYESADEIPYEALVIDDEAEKCRSKSEGYRNAIGQMALASKERFATYFAADSGITGLRQADDSDYDIVRRRYADVEGAGVVRLGLSLELDPKSESSKRSAFRPVQERFFKQKGAFLDLRIYQSGESDRMIDDLLKNELDIGELRPIFAGRAFAESLRPLMTPRYRDLDKYDAYLIRKTKGGDEKFDYPDSASDKTIAVLEDKMSASSYAWPISKLLEKKIRFMTTEKADEWSIVKAVLDKSVDLGAIAKFKLDNFQNPQHQDYKKSADAVQVISEARFEIPMGAYVVNRRLSEDSKERDSWRAPFLSPTMRLAGGLSFGAPPIKEQIDDMKGIYLFVRPKSTVLKRLIVGTVGFTLLAVLIMFFTYRPKPTVATQPVAATTSTASMPAPIAAFAGETKGTPNQSPPEVACPSCARTGHDKDSVYCKYCSAPLTSGTASVEPPPAEGSDDLEFS